MDIVDIDKCRYEIQEQKKFRYGILANAHAHFKHWLQ
jgi:hypothetical protein